MQQHITLELSAEQAVEYQKAILAVLAKVEIAACEASYKEHIKTVYKLLEEFNPKNFSITKPSDEPLT